LTEGDPFCPSWTALGEDASAGGPRTVLTLAPRLRTVGPVGVFFWDVPQSGISG
jgi:hypothetical protein